MFFMRSSEIYSRIRAIRFNQARREEQRALAEEIMTKRKVWTLELRACGAV